MGTNTIRNIETHCGCPSEQFETEPQHEPQERDAKFLPKQSAAEDSAQIVGDRQYSANLLDTAATAVTSATDSLWPDHDNPRNLSIMH